MHDTALFVDAARVLHLDVDRTVSYHALPVSGGYVLVVCGVLVMYLVSDESRAGPRYLQDLLGQGGMDTCASGDH